MFQKLVLTAYIFASFAASAANNNTQIIATFTNDMFSNSVTTFQIEMDSAGVIQQVIWHNPSYQPVPPEHKIGALAKWVALDTYQSYDTIILRGGPIDYVKGEGKFVFGFMNSGGYLQCPFTLRKIGDKWAMFPASADAQNAKPIKRVHAIISMFSGIQEIQGGLRCR